VEVPVPRNWIESVTNEAIQARRPNQASSIRGICGPPGALV
jgi:hypothetical protein